MFTRMVKGTGVCCICMNGGVNHLCESVWVTWGHRHLLYGWVMTVIVDYGVAGDKLHTKHKDTHTLRYCMSARVHENTQQVST